MDENLRCDYKSCLWILNDHTNMVFLIELFDMEQSKRFDLLLQTKAMIHVEAMMTLEN